MNPKQWEDLKESMHDEYFLEKSARGQKGRNLVKDRYFLGRGGLRAKQHMCKYMVFFLNSVHFVMPF